jgi:hypothetical protein
VPKVTKDVPSRAIVAGNPAKIIRKIKLSFQSVEFIESIELKAKECRIAKREHPLAPEVPELKNQCLRKSACVCGEKESVGPHQF